MNVGRNLLCLASGVLIAGSAHCGPYMGLQFKQLYGTRSSYDYETNQMSVIVGYELRTESGFWHSLEYLGSVGSSSGQVGPYNVETTIATVGYKLMYRGFFGKIAYAKLDRDDRDLEATSDRAQVESLGYEYEFNQTTSVHITREWMRNSSVKTKGYSIGAIFRF